MSSMAIWQGFDYSWQGSSHRVNRLACSIDSFNQTPQGQVSGRYTSVMKFGEYGDVGDAFTSFSRINCDRMSFVHGTVEETLSAAVGTATRKVGTPISVTVPSTPETGGAPAKGGGGRIDEPQQARILSAPTQAATALLRGFSVRCLSHPAGITTRGFGVDLINQRREGPQFVFEPTYEIAPDNNPDRPSQDPPIYRYALRVFYTVLIAPPTDARFTRNPESSSPFLSRYDGPKDVPLQRPIDVQGPAAGPQGAFAHAVLGIHGFQWRLYSWPGTARDGRYLRRLLFTLKDAGYTSQSGTATVLFATLFSNEAAISYGYDAEHTLGVTLIQYNGDRPPANITLHNVVNPDVNDTTQQTFLL